MTSELSHCLTTYFERLNKDFATAKTKQQQQQYKDEATRIILTLEEATAFESCSRKLHANLVAPTGDVTKKLRLSHR